MLPFGKLPKGPLVRIILAATLPFAPGLLLGRVDERQRAEAQVEAIRAGSRSGTWAETAPATAITTGVTTTY
jgi:hypothetical protein